MVCVIYWVHGAGKQACATPIHRYTQIIIWVSMETVCARVTVGLLVTITFISVSLLSQFWYITKPCIFSPVFQLECFAAYPFTILTYLKRFIEQTAIVICKTYFGTPAFLKGFAIQPLHPLAKTTHETQLKFICKQQGSYFDESS